MNTIIRKINESDLKKIVGIALRNFNEIVSRARSKEIPEKINVPNI